MKRFFSAVIILFVANYLMATEFSPSGEISALAGAGLPWTHDNSGEYIAGNLSLSGNVKVDSNNSSAYIDASLICDALKARSSSSRFDFVSGDNSLQIRLKEAWMDYDGGIWSLRLGRQISAWGKADGLQVADILCPKDESKMIASSYSESRLGVDGVRLSLNSEKIVCEGYWIPFFTPSSLPLADGNPLKKILIPENYVIGNTTFSINPVSNDTFTLPETKLYNSEVALRIASFFSFADFSIYGFYGFDREPVLSYELGEDGSSISIKGSYKRMAMAGADAAIPVKDVVLRFEGAFFPEKYFTNEVKINQIKALAGFDWMPSSWTITAQYYLDYVFDEEDELDRDSYEHKVSLNISKSLFQETMEISISGILGLINYDSMISAEAKYSLSDSMTLSLGSDLFIPGPEEKGEWGMYEDLSCAYIKGIYRF